MHETDTHRFWCRSCSCHPGTGSGITLESGLSLCDLQFYEQRRLNGEYAAIVRADLAHLVLFYELQCIAYGLSIQCNLIVSLGIHEVVQITIFIQILHILSINTRLRALLSRTEGLLNYTATLDVLQLGSNESCALSRLNMLEFDNLVNIVIILNGNTISEITCRNYNVFLLIFSRHNSLIF